MQKQPSPALGRNGGISSHQHCASPLSPAQRIGAPQREQLRLGVPVSKLAHRTAHEGELTSDARAAFADDEVQAQVDALEGAEAPVEALRSELRRFLAGEELQHQMAFFPNQFISMHSRNAMRAR